MKNTLISGPAQVLENSRSTISATALLNLGFKCQEPRLMFLASDLIFGNFLIPGVTQNFYSTPNV